MNADLCNPGSVLPVDGVQSLRLLVNGSNGRFNFGREPRTRFRQQQLRLGVYHSYRRANFLAELLHFSKQRTKLPFALILSP